MKIKNNLGHSIEVPKEHEETVKNMIAQGDHDGLTKLASGGWIKHAVNPKHKGFCTPMTKKTCTPRRKALARTFKKHHGFHKEHGGEVPCAECGGEIGKSQTAGGGIGLQDGGKIMWNTPKYGYGENGLGIYQAGGQGGGDDQLQQQVAQMLQQGAQPQQVLSQLVKKGMKQDQAQQLVQQVMQQMQQEQGPPQAQIGIGLKMRKYQDGGQPQGDPSQQAPQQDPSQGQGDPSQQGGQGGQEQQIVQEVAQALQQGAQPQQILQELVKQGVPQQQAQQIIQQVMQQMQQQGGGQGAQGGDPSQQQQQQDPSQQQAPDQGQQGGGEMPQARGGLRMKGAVKGQQQGDATAQIQRLAQKVAQNDPQALQVLKTLPPAAQQQVMQMVQQMGQQQQAQGDTGQGDPNQQPQMWAGGRLPIALNGIGTPLAGGSPYLGYYGSLSAYYNAVGQDYSQQAKKDQAEADKMRTTFDPNNTSGYGAVDALSRQAGLEKRTAGALKFTSDAAGVDQGIHDIAGAAGGISTLFSNYQAKQQDEQQRLYTERNNRAVISPIHGGDPTMGGQVGSNPAFKRWGGIARNGTAVGDGYAPNLFRMMYQDGGQVPTEGSAFKSQDPNVMTERGETIQDPTKGPTGSDGQPTGAVVHDTTGDQHSDPSGGNAYKLGQNSVVHSKALGVKVGDFLEYAKGFPDAAKIIAAVQAKYPNPDKEVSFAKISALFDTAKLLKEVSKIEREAEKNEKHGADPNSTKVTKTTAGLNRKTLGSQLEQKKAEIQQNSQIAGADGPMHAMSETLKGAGAYGPKVQQEQQDQAQNPEAKFGKKIKMRVGGKLKLPTYQHSGPAVGTGDDVYASDNGALKVSPKINMRNVPQGVDNNGEVPVTPSRWFRNPHNQMNAPLQQVAPQVTPQVTPQIQMAQGPVNTQQAVAPIQGPVTPTYTFNSGTSFPSSTNGQFKPEEVHNVWDNTYQSKSKEDIRKEQETLGYQPGFNNFPSYDHPEQFMQNMVNAGFAGDWTSPTVNKDMQNHLMDKALSDPRWEEKAKRVYERYLTTSQGYGAALDKNNKHTGTVPWTALNNDQKRAWLADDQNGVRTYDMAAALAEQGSPAQAPTIAGTTKIDTSGINDAGSVAHGAKKRIFTQGQTADVGDVAALLAPRRPVPYVEDKGAADALAATTRQRFVNPYTGDVQRALLAKTWNNTNDPVARARMAQDKANSYEESQKRFSEADRENAGIEQKYSDEQNRLRQAAGTNKATALNSGVTRNAQAVAAAEKQYINALGDLDYKSKERAKDNFASALYQQRSPNVNLLPFGQLQDVAGGHDILHEGVARLDEAGFLSPIDKQRLAKARDLGADYYKKEAETILDEKKALMMGFHNKKYGGKVGRVSPKMLKKKK